MIMRSNPLPDPVLISTQGDLTKLANTLSKQPLIAVDTEANSLYAYQEKVCLIQFSIPGMDYLVDPISLKDLSSLGNIFNNPRIEKIFHAAEYDLIILKRDFGFSFNFLFDTMVASRVLGWKAVGLGTILENQFGVVLNKRYQRANWGQRPLPREMLTYAQRDTHYLIPLRDLLKTELVSKGLWELALEDFRRVSQVDFHHQDREPVNCWRINGVHDLEPQKVAVLQELCQFRETVAQTTNRPLFKVISDHSLVNIANTMPGSLSELEQIPGVSRKQMQWIGKGLVAAVRRGSNLQPPEPPRSNRFSDQHLNRIDLLRNWRKSTARKLGVESDVVLPRDLLFTLAKENPKTRVEIEKIMESVPWRFGKFGEEIRDLLRTLEG